MGNQHSPPPCLIGWTAPQSVNTTLETWADVPGEVLLFTSKPVIKDVLEVVESCAVLPSD